MQSFFEIARTDFAATFSGAWIFPILIIGLVLIFLKEPDGRKKLLMGVFPLIILFIYWFPVTGMLFIKLLGKKVYWRFLWLLPIAVTIPYACCVLLRCLSGRVRSIVFLICIFIIGFSGKKVLSEEWFLASTNAYKIPQNVIDVCEKLPGNIHAMVSNRLMPYIRQYDTTITLEFGRNALKYNGQTEVKNDSMALYLEAQKSEIDLSVLLPLAENAGCTFLVFSNNRTYIGEWEEYGYYHYASTDEFDIFADADYEEGEDTRKWEE